MPERVVARLNHFEIGNAWLLDPASGIDGRGSIRVEGGVITRVNMDRTDAGEPPALMLTPGFADLHCHLRRARSTEVEDASSVLAAAARGGFTTISVMANLQPPTDRPEALLSLAKAAGAASSPVRLLAYGTVSAERNGVALAPLSSLAQAGAAAFSDDGSPVAERALLRAALSEAGALGRAIVEHAEETTLTAGWEANEGLAATILGLRGAPPAAEWSAVASAISVLRQVVREAPGVCTPRLHLTHLSTAESLALVRLAKDEGLPVTCDVTPHHLCLHDGWVGTDRRFAWESAGAPWLGQSGPAGVQPDGVQPYDSSTRVNPPLRSATDALALLRGVADGTVDAIATDHAPHRQVDKDVEYGDAAPGISGLETCLGLVLAAVEAGCLEMRDAVAAMTGGPWRVLGEDACGRSQPTLTIGVEADFVLVDRLARSVVDPEAFASRGRNTPLTGRTLPGRVLLTVAAGKVAYADPSTISW